MAVALRRRRLPLRKEAGAFSGRSASSRAECFKMLVLTKPRQWQKLRNISRNDFFLTLRKSGRDHINPDGQIIQLLWAGIYLVNSKLESCNISPKLNY